MDGGASLVERCSQHFDKWWDPEKFDWDESWALAKYCSQHFQWKLDGIRLGKLKWSDLTPKDIVRIKKALDKQS